MRNGQSGILIGGLAALFVLSGCATVVPATPAGGLTHAEVAGIVAAANEGQLELARLATTRAANAEVRQFAQQMIDDHTQGHTNTQQLLGRLNVTPAESEWTRRLRESNRQTLEALGTWEGADFDRRFMDHQVALHQWLARSLDQTLIPSVTNRQLRTHLEQTRAGIGAHTTEAQRVRGRL
jgi:putative membrane protein